MAFFKKNPLLCLIVLVCVLSFGAGTYLALNASGKVSDAQRKLSTAESQLRGVLAADPAPTEANLQASEQNMEALLGELSGIREDLQRGARLKISSDSVGVIAGIQQYISEFRRMTAEHKGSDGAVDPIQTPADFGFGFQQYLNEAKPYENVEITRMLDKQRQILSYLLIQLIEANPDSIDLVEREVRELRTEKNRPRGDFEISPAISARVPGAVDTLAFRIGFTGYTDALRGFINRLAEFELPIVVRSVEVSRPSGSETVAARPNAGNGFDALFAAAEEGIDEPITEAQKPVISENVSRFTVIVEFIEIVLPEANPNPEAAL